MPDFCHLHCHTQFSLLDGAAKIDALMQKAKEDDMKAVALTDHGNMFGAFKFYTSAKKHGIMPIIGCEFYMVEDRHKQKFERHAPDKRYHQLLLAKNEQGYRNISKLCSLGFIEGWYNKFPRIDMELLLQYKDGIIATTCCAAAIVPRTFYDKGEEAAEKVFLEFLEIFGEDYYIELQRHNMQGLDEEGLNQFLIKLSKKHNVKTIVTNDSHYVDQTDYNAHDILLCVNTGDFKRTPAGERNPEKFRFELENGEFFYNTLQEAMRQFPDSQKVKAVAEMTNNKGFKPRFGFENDQFYFKTKAEMAAMFPDIPEALDNTLEIVSKIQTPELARDILLPNFKLPPEFTNMDDYLRHLTFEGAQKKYGEITQEADERLNFELNVIKHMGFAGYFLIVQDFIAEAVRKGVSVGPGRGSAAGSAVAYSIGITNVDPLKYGLLFERFLNPDRISMPDIDIDFDDEGRQKVIDYVVDKYGKDQVAQIITYGTMAARSAIRDVGRVLELPLSETDKLAKMIPPSPGMNFKKAYEENPELKAIRKQENDQRSKVLQIAEKLEGSVRHRGIHAAGIIIAPESLLNLIPVCTSSETELLVTQFDGKLIEDAGMLKMDFLGLKNLTIIKDAVRLIKENHGVELIPDQLPLDDKKTLELFQRGATNGIFQFESDGMKKSMKSLKPDKFEDLIAMNALYRPGPIEYIPNYVARKHGKEPITYDLPDMEEYLAETYGITVYQEQVMLLSQKLANFSKGDADLLRKAMGKKIKKMLDELKPKFIEGCKTNGHDEKIAEKIWIDWEKFASYAFNKSHSTCYAFVAFQTAYLKAHYPAEYMAAVLTCNMSDIEKIKFFLNECQRMGIKALGPDINESFETFTVNSEGEIRFALSGVKGVGSAAVAEIIRERNEGGPFTSIFDLTRRVGLKTVNKKSLESLAYAGAFDAFEVSRSAYFEPLPREETYLIEKAIKYGNHYQRSLEQAHTSLFGDSFATDVAEPAIPDAAEWPVLKRLKFEKQYTGIYISGHPLDDYKADIKHFTTFSISDMHENKEFRGEIAIAGIVTSAKHITRHSGAKMGTFTLEDFDGGLVELWLGRERDYHEKKHYLEEGLLLHVKGVFERWKETDEPRFKITEISPLSEVRQKLAKEIIVILPAAELTEELVHELEEIVEKHPGQFGLKIELRSDAERCRVELFSSKYRVDVSNELIRYLNEHELLEYKLN